MKRIYDAHDLDEIGSFRYLPKSEVWASECCNNGRAGANFFWFETMITTGLSFRAVSIKQCFPSSGKVIVDS
jgi:hypothetical protein